MNGAGDVVRPAWATPQRARRLLLASTLDHVLPSVARVANAMGLTVGTAPGLLDVVDHQGGRRIDRLLERLARELTAAETESVRVTADPPADGVSLATRLLTAPTLAVELARRGITAEIALLTDAELWPVYQPIMSLTSGGMVGHEALLRGRVDGREVGGGDLFFLAERAGWLSRLDRLAREAAIAGAAHWLGGADLYVNSNPAAIHRPSVCLAGTERAVHEAGIDPRQLVFEVVAPPRRHRPGAPALRARPPPLAGLAGRPGRRRRGRGPAWSWSPSSAPTWSSSARRWSAGWGSRDRTRSPARCASWPTCRAASSSPRAWSTSGWPTRPAPSARTSARAGSSGARCDRSRRANPS
ncbi:hypothetical protein A7K94_0210625 [Modestobacter sp. VKM Ac-2676]|nr:hypothetical protein A7K94_0210625 [Modestobacter sp. VKM Ac-2676]